MCLLLTLAMATTTEPSAAVFGWTSEIRVHIRVRTFQACVYTVHPSGCRCFLVGVLLPLLGDNFAVLLLLVAASRWLSYVH